jgi:hypothetical protein
MRQRKLPLLPRIGLVQLREVAVEATVRVVLTTTKQVHTHVED